MTRLRLNWLIWRRFPRPVVHAARTRRARLFLLFATVTTLIVVLYFSVERISRRYWIHSLLPGRDCAAANEDPVAARDTVVEALKIQTPEVIRKTLDGLQHSVACHPDNAEMHGALGTLMLGRVDAGAAYEFDDRVRALAGAREYATAARLEPKRLEWTLREGEAWEKIGWLARAARVLERGYQIDPDSDDLVTVYARVLLYLKQVDKAEDVLELYVQSDASDRDPHAYAAACLSLGRIMISEGRKEEAMSLLRWSTEHSEELLGDKLGADYSGCAFQALGRLYGEAGRFDKGIENVLRAAELDFQKEPAQINAAILSYRLGQFEKALFFIRSQTGAVNRSKTAFALKALILLALGRDDEARGVMESPLMTTPGDDDDARELDRVIADVFWGHWALKNKRWPEAERRFRNVTDHETIVDAPFHYVPVDQFNTVEGFLREMALLGMAWTSSAQERHEEALAYYDQIIRVVPSHFFAGLGRATSLSGLGRHQEVAVELKRLAEMYPENAYITNQLGILALNEGDIDEARSRFENAAVAGGPTYSCPYEGLGLAYLKQNKPAEAEEMLSRAIEIAPDRDAKKYNALARIRIEQGRFAEARDLVERALANIPGDTEATEILESLNNAEKKTTTPAAP